MSLTSSLLVARHGAQAPRVSTHPEYRTTAGDDAIELAEAIGLMPMPWQKYVLRHALGERPDGTWSAKDVSVWVPRQNGKGTLIEIRVMAGLFIFGERLILWSAHEYKTAQEGFLRIKELIQNAPDLHKLVKRYWEANGEQGIELVNGNRLRFVARSRGSGRGFTGDLIILDEAQELQLPMMKALYPTLAARPNPQVWYLGTPPDDPSAWVYGLRERGQAGAERMAHFDWGIDGDPTDPEILPRLADRELWYQANPSLGYLLTEENCADELTTLQEGFAAERLGMWLPRATSGAGIIPADLWRDQALPVPERPDDVALSVVINHRRSHTAIVAVGALPDGRLVASVVDYRSGTHWVVDRLVDLRERYRPVAIALQDKGPTASLMLDLERAGITPPDDPDRPARGDLAIPWAQELAAGYGMTVDAITQRRLWHLDDAPLNLAVQQAQIRPLGSGTAWDYKVDSSAPLIGMTQALWAWLTRHELVDKDRDEPFNIW